MSTSWLGEKVTWILDIEYSSLIRSQIEENKVSNFGSNISSFGSFILFISTSNALFIPLSDFRFFSFSLISRWAFSNFENLFANFFWTWSSGSVATVVRGSRIDRKTIFMTRIAILRFVFHCSHPKRCWNVDFPKNSNAYRWFSVLMVPCCNWYFNKLTILIQSRIS